VNILAFKGVSIVATMVMLSGCTQPLSSLKKDVSEIAGNLGEGRKIIDSGIYQMTSTDWEGLDIDDIFDATSSERPDMSEFVAVQWHSVSKSYASSWGNVSYFDFDGQYYIMEWRAPDARGGAFYLPVEVISDGIIIYVYDCDDIPQNFRQAKGLDDSCTVSDSATMLRAMGLMNFEQMGNITFSIQSTVNDLGESP